MPVDRERTILNSGTVGIAEYDDPAPSFMETVGAAYRQENLIGSAFAKQRTGHPDLWRVDMDHEVDFTGYEDHIDKFLDVGNLAAENAVKADIDRERKDRETLNKAGIVGVGVSMGAALADPTILMPAGAFVRGSKVGFSALKSGASVGAAAAAATAVQEAGLQSTQLLRTGEESAINIGGSAILGGIVGVAGAKLFTSAEWSRFSKALEEDLAADVPEATEIVDTIVTRLQAGGADVLDDVKLDDLGIGGGRAAEAVANATAALRINPGIETMTSPSVKVRETLTKLVDNPVYNKMNMEGKSLGRDVENSVKEYQRGRLSQWIRGARDEWKQAKQTFGGSRSDFYDRVARAGRRGDVDPQGNIHVTRMAELARKLIFDPLLERAKKLGLLPEDVTVSTAASYVTRLWNRQKLIGQENDFRRIAGDYFKKAMAEVPAEQKVDFVSEDDLDDYIKEVVTSVFNNLTGRGVGEIPEWIVPVTRGPLKERTFNIPDEMIEEFLENDMELILTRYTRTMGAEVELTEKFGRADMRDQFEAINQEYSDLSEAAKTPKEKTELEKARKRDVKNLEAFRDMVRGTYRTAEEGTVWSTLTRAALTWNYMRLLGGVTLTSLTDSARLVGVHGLRATMTEAIPSLISNLEAVRISKMDARDLGAVAEVILQTRLASLADLQDPYRYGSQYERYLSNASNMFSKATGLGWWNDTMKSMASVMTQNRMARNSLDWAGMNARERAYMGFLNIDEEMAGRIAKQVKKHGVKEKNIWGANVSKWDDVEAGRSWAAALNKDVDRTIVTKGVADTPLFMKENWGKLIFQFKSFGMASHQRVLISGLQERPHRMAEQMVFASAIGMLISWLKFKERGDDEQAQRLLDNPGLWIANGLDRTGILSLPFEASNTAEKLGMPFGITTAAQKIAGDEDQGGTVSRYASRNKLGAFLGPTAGLFQDLTTIAEQLSKAELKKSGAGAIIRQIPGGSLPGVRSTLHGAVKPQIEEALE